MVDVDISRRRGLSAALPRERIGGFANGYQVINSGVEVLQTEDHSLALAEFRDPSQVCSAFSHMSPVITSTGLMGRPLLSNQCHAG